MTKWKKIVNLLEFRSQLVRILAHVGIDKLLILFVTIVPTYRSPTTSFSPAILLSSSSSSSSSAIQSTNISGGGGAPVMNLAIDMEVENERKNFVQGLSSETLLLDVPLDKLNTLVGLQNSLTFVPDNLKKK